MRLGLIGLVSATAVAAALTAAAASLGGIVPRELGAGYAPISACDSDGVTVTYAVTSGAVQSMTVAGLAATCTNGSIRAALTNASATSIGAGGPTTVTGSSVTLTLSPQPSANAVEGVHISIVGP